MVKRNPHIAQLKSHYLFPEINQRKREFLTRYPDAKLISLGVGDTTEPLPFSIMTALSDSSKKLGTRSGYTGYGPEQGVEPLRKKIAEVIYGGLVQPDDIFISDGAKCDIGRLQILFGSHNSIAIQDPSYPVYLDGSKMQGISKITFLPCSPENNFFPNLKLAKGVDLIYFCSPNNPTGVAATYAQLEELVEFAKKNGSIILYDSAYSSYIQDDRYPKSIFEIKGAKEVALETSSFSKMAGFTGVRLGWTVVPEELKFEDGSSVRKDWNRVTSTIFNGASTISQAGGLSILEKVGQQEVETLISFYKENGRIISQALLNKGFEVYGGTQAPYLWVRFKGKSSWDVFQDLLEKLHLVTTPGSGFGPGGEEFIRFTSFGSREKILEAASRIQKLLPQTLK